MKFLITIILFTTLFASTPQKVSIQLQYLHQFQFAGYYMAKEKGFYKDVGLDVDIKEYSYGLDTTDEVLTQRATYGIGRSSLISLSSQGEEIVLLSATFQSTPLILLALENSSIKTIKDFKNKKIMLTRDRIETASIHAMINSNGVDESSLEIKMHTFDLNELIDSKVDLYFGYSSNEPYTLDKKGIAYKTFSPNDYGFTFYSDLLFTSEYEIEHNRQRAKDFRDASLKGWEYAFNHVGESVDLIYRKYNTQNKTKEALVYEAYSLKKLAYVPAVKLGEINPEKIMRTFDVYKVMGFTKNDLNLDKFIFERSNSLIIRYIKKIDKYFYEFLFFILAMTFIFFYRQYILNKKNNELQRLQDELLELNLKLDSKASNAMHDLERAQEVAKIGSWVYDLSKNQFRCSQQTYKIFDIDKNSKNLYKKFMKRVHSDDRLDLKNNFILSLKEQKHSKMEHRIVMNDGSIKYIQERYEITCDEEFNPMVTYGTIQDITDKVLSKLELKKKDAYLLHQTRLAQMGEMLSMIAHQWRQPLSSISATRIAINMAIELEKYDLSEEEQRKEFLEFLTIRLEKIGLYVENLSQTINDFSDFYKPNKHSEILKMDELALKAYKLIEDSTNMDFVEIILDFNSFSDVKVHTSEFLQVVLSIVNNAREQLKQNSIENPFIRIKSYDLDDDIYLEISDNAGGIDKDVIQQIFDPYFSTKQEKNGTGLGLYMAKTIIEDYHNGVIYAQNNDNGAIFTIIIKKYKE